MISENPLTSQIVEVTSRERVVKQAIETERKTFLDDLVKFEQALHNSSAEFQNGISNAFSCLTDLASTDEGIRDLNLLLRDVFGGRIVLTPVQTPVQESICIVKYDVPEAIDVIFSGGVFFTGNRDTNWSDYYALTDDDDENVRWEALGFSNGVLMHKRGEMYVGFPSFEYQSFGILASSVFHLFDETVVADYIDEINGLQPTGDNSGDISESFTPAYFNRGQLVPSNLLFFGLQALETRSIENNVVQLTNFVNSRKPGMVVRKSYEALGGACAATTQEFERVRQTAETLLDKFRKIEIDREEVPRFLVPDIPALPAQYQT